MIVQPLIIPKNILQTEALESRLPQQHVKKEILENNARSLRAGYNGELALDFPLSFLPYEKYLIFYYLRLPDSSGSFQIDTLILSSEFMLIIEAKNMKDHVIYNDMGQTIRIENEKEQAYTNPVDQVNLQHLRLLHWMRQFDFPPVPIEKIAVYTNPKMVLINQSGDSSLSEKVMHKEKILAKIDEFTTKHTTKCLSENQLMRLSYHLTFEHTPKEEQVLEKYDISYKELIKGVKCPSCKSIPMKWQKAKWFCEHCRKASKTAHKSALSDYALLVSEYISNRQARDFLQLDSLYVVKRLLLKDSVAQFGKKSGRKYKLDYRKLLDG